MIARNAQTVLDGLAAIARYLYVHSPALEPCDGAGAERRYLRFAYEMTELEPSPAPDQGYELSMANGARIVRLLGGAERGASLRLVPA